jgi:3',5'-cyclic AMP phosphodiesterase CpdA
MDERARTRRQMASELSRPGLRPGPLGLTRRTFLHKSLLAGVGGAAAYGWFPLLNTIDVASGAETFKFAYVSDTHLYPKAVNTRFVEKAEQAVTDIRAMSPPADFVIFGGDLAQLGDPVELKLGAEILAELKIKTVLIPGEHDWYLDMGATWEKQFGRSPWTFDHKGVRFIGLDTVSHAPDFWTAKKLSPKERMLRMATFDGSTPPAWAGVGLPQLEWLQRTLSSWSKAAPVVIFSHNPLYEYYPPWQFWVRDWREVHEVLKPYTNVTNIHGHVHHPSYSEVGTTRFVGMLATSWPWPYPPQVPLHTRCMVRADPGDPFDGVGWSRLTATAAGRVENEYVMWRKDVLAEASWDSGCADNANQLLSPRIADQEWLYYGPYR